MLCVRLNFYILAQTRKTRIISVEYNASSNELVRTQTLVKNCIVRVDATPFRQWYEAHYAVPLGRKRGAKLVYISLLLDYFPSLLLWNCIATPKAFVVHEEPRLSNVRLCIYRALELYEY